MPARWLQGRRAGLPANERGRPMATVAKTVEVRSSRSLAGAKVREALVGYGFILLPMSIFAIWYLYPLGYAIYISFFDWGVFGKISSVGTRNYDQLFHDQFF